jgi:hypothetical protein
MAFNLTNAANILKVRYLDPIREQLNGATILLDKIGRDDLMISGKSWTIPLHASRNTSAGTGVSDGGAMPTAGQQGYDVSVVPNCYIYGRIQITGPTIQAARDNAGAFVRAVESEVNGLVRDMKKSVNRQLHSNGTDALCYWTGADDTSGTNVDDNQGNGFTHLPTSGTVVVDVIDATDNVTELASDMTITPGAITSTCQAITWAITTASSGTADGDYAVPAGTLGYQLMGIDGLIHNTNAGTPVTSTAGLQSMSVATYPYWKAQVYGNSGTKRDLTLALMQAPLSAIATNSDYTEADVAFLLGNYGLRDKYVSLLVAEKRFVNTMRLDGGWSGVEFNGIPLVADPQCKRSTLYYIVPETMKILRTSDFNWMERDGAMLSRVVGYDTYDAVLYHYGNLAVFTRNGNGRLNDITDS